ncbi:thioredoxin-like protein YusE [Lentibacillus kapialis]|uniref:Thioredoxin-like protein YusE n=1 Tax=Lentibacillus kapialis TaxID=340214 RepID=A0A917PS99_9BACI|nr:thioredoxin family protein [Lentibacillus kapialis]GGJ90069.1 thioredoxin-like protein YusE [Lentibacillus kapialis]
MQQITDDVLQQERYLLYIYTPFCGTCALARSMLEKIEAVHQQNIFYEMNASLNPDFMQNYKVESVPSLLIKQDGEVKDKVYAFKSIANVYSYLMTYKPELFAAN